MARRALVCAAFGVWCFLNTWVELAEGNGAYFARRDPMRAVVAPALCWQILIATAMFALWSLWRRAAPRWRAPGRYAFLLSCLVPFGVAAVAFLRVLPFDAGPLVANRLFWPLAIAAALVPCAWVIRRPAAASRRVRGLLLYSWPLLAVVGIQAWRATLRFPPALYADGPLAAASGAPAPRARVVWIVFDELSREIAFDRRPPGLELPNLDRLRSESFEGSAARSPSESTETSLPALTLGRRVTAATRAAPNRLLLSVEGSPEPVAWNDAPNIFDTARRLGYDTALAGWFHPYGRLLNRSLTRCYWTATWLLPGIEEPSAPRPLAGSLGDRAALQWISLPLVGHLPGMSPARREREALRKRFSYLRDRAVEIAADARIGLAFIHLPVPHPPAIYSRKERRFATSGPVDYLDSLALADETLGIIRRAMLASGQWDRSAVLLSSDHGWRPAIWRARPDWTREEEELASHGDTLGVPFFLKLPAQRTGLRYDTPFDTVVSAGLVAAILEGSLTDPAQAPGMLHQLEALTRP